MPPRVGADGTVAHRSTPASWSAHSPSQNACTPSSIRAAPWAKPLLVEPRLGVRLDELVRGVGGVLVLHLVVPGPEGERQSGALAGLEGLQPGDELLPEARRGPVLDGVARPLGHRGVLGAVHLEELVAEEEGGRRCRAGACRGRRSRARAAPRSAAATRSGRHRSGSDHRRRCPRWPRAPGRCPCGAGGRPALNTTPSSLRRISLPAR